MMQLSGKIIKNRAYVFQINERIYVIRYYNAGERPTNEILSKNPEIVRLKILQNIDKLVSLYVRTVIIIIILNELLRLRRLQLHRVKIKFGADIGISLKLYKDSTFNWRALDAIHLLISHRSYSMCFNKNHYY